MSPRETAQGAAPAVFGMQRFGECNVDNTPAVYQPGEFIDVDVRDGLLVLEIDCYSFMRQGSDEEFDVDQWEDERLYLLQPAEVPMRAFWYEAFKVARALLSGRTVHFRGGESANLAEYVAARRAAPVVKVGRPDGLVGEDEIAAAMGCTVEAVRERAEREGWAYWIDSGADQPMVHVTPAKAN